MLLEYEVLKENKNLLLMRNDLSDCFKDMFSDCKGKSLEPGRPSRNGCPDPCLERYIELDVVTCQGKRKRN